MMKYQEISVLNQICRQMGVTATDTLKTTRIRPICEARQMFMYWLRTNTNYTLLQISRMVRTVPLDHTTVIHSCQNMSDLISTDEAMKAIWESLKFINVVPFTSLSHRHLAQ